MCVFSMYSFPVAQLVEHGASKRQDHGFDSQGKQVTVTWMQCKLLWICEPTTFCAGNTMLYHWATGTQKDKRQNTRYKKSLSTLSWACNALLNSDSCSLGSLLHWEKERRWGWRSPRIALRVSAKDLPHQIWPLDPVCYYKHLSLALCLYYAN